MRSTPPGLPVWRRVAELGRFARACRVALEDGVDPAAVRHAIEQDDAIRAFGTAAFEPTIAGLTRAVVARPAQLPAGPGAPGAGVGGWREKAALLVELGERFSLCRILWRAGVLDAATPMASLAAADAALERELRYLSDLLRCDLPAGMVVADLRNERTLIEAGRHELGYLAALVLEHAETREALARGDALAPATFAAIDERLTPVVATLVTPSRQATLERLLAVALVAERGRTAPSPSGEALAPVAGRGPQRPR